MGGETGGVEEREKRNNGTEEGEKETMILAPTERNNGSPNFKV